MGYVLIIFALGGIALMMWSGREEIKEARDYVENNRVEMYKERCAIKMWARIRSLSDSATEEE